ncbi:MAG: hypothetical protein HFF97_04470 [Oscillibacter sp.]|jgi:hypothetical protein|uniref:hypothetical protein n=1 Tax=uncultured Oscillibacter sp. TaxID=876091 RepID=UPI002173D10A|nr:hypothetical protein [uncultured Oscillibacter sp.]MCI9643966.1 hypothetical protein [Oscillibacter sp.]
MAMFTPRPLAKSHPLEDPAGDYKSARRAEQYRYSGSAIYFPAFPGTQYLSFASLSRALTRNTSLPLTGCCGKALPVTRLRLYYDGGEFYQDFTFEKLASANEVLDAVSAARPGLPLEREERPQSAI